MNDFDSVTKKRLEDHIVFASRAIVGLIPGSGPILEYWAEYLGTPGQKRLESWLMELYDLVKNLEEKKGITMQDLQENDEFFDALLRITPLVQATSQKEKHEAFKNALTHLALNLSPGDTKKHLFIRLIDTLSVDHIKVLKFLDNPYEWFSNRSLSMPYGGGSLIKHLNLGMANTGNEFVVLLILKELGSYSLISENMKPNTSWNGHEAQKRRTAPLGVEFLEFISLVE